MQSKRPQYDLNQSPLFKLRGKNQLAHLLQVAYEDLAKMGTTEGYRVFPSEDGRRLIEAPIGPRLSLHKRLARIFAKIQTPDYVYAAKGRSYVDNGAAHAGMHPVVKTDVRQFFPSVSEQAIYRCFRYLFCISADVARVLAKVCCYNGHLPTGSPLSGYLAFFAAKPMFDDVHAKCEGTGCRFTLYVDDITISGAPASRSLLADVVRTVEQHGFRIRNKKSVSYAPRACKSITGVIVTPDGIRLPNARHLKIREARQAIRSCPPEDVSRVADLKLRLIGREREARQILSRS